MFRLILDVYHHKNFSVTLRCLLIDLHGAVCDSLDLCSALVLLPVKDESCPTPCPGCKRGQKF